MHQEPKIVTLANKKLVGQAIEMSLTENKTFNLFSGFMPNRGQINHTLGSKVYEVMIYNEAYFKNFNPANTFKKWAALEVSKYNVIPESMKTLDIEMGLYAVFQYKGLQQGFGQLMNYIMMQWLPESKYHLDNRPYFNVLGERYKNNSPDSEEDVFIPIKLK